MNSTRTKLNQQIKKYDSIQQAIAKLIELVFPFFPAPWLCTARERACFLSDYSGFRLAYWVDTMFQTSEASARTVDGAWDRAHTKAQQLLY